MYVHKLDDEATWSPPEADAGAGHAHTYMCMCMCHRPLRLRLLFTQEERPSHMTMVEMSRLSRSGLVANSPLVLSQKYPSPQLPSWASVYPRFVSLVNLTPHDVIIMHSDTPSPDDEVIPPSGTVARIQTYPLAYFTDPDLPSPIPCRNVSFSIVTGLPPLRYGVFLIVSLPTALALRQYTSPDSLRSDILVPYDEVRDPASGRILGCRALARVTGGAPQPSPQPSPQSPAQPTAHELG